jgi:type IV secretion system protein VirB4
VPYTAHVSEHVVRTRHGHYVQSFRLGGISFESADDEQLNNWHERLNILWRNIASPNVAVWTHVIRRREHTYCGGRFPPGFASELNEKYRQRLTHETLMVNELYVSLVYRPQHTAVGNVSLRLLKIADRDSERAELCDSLDICEKLEQQVLAGLHRYEPEVLGVYQSGSIYCSSLLEFMSVLLNGERQRMPVPRAPINEVLSMTRPFFGLEALEYRTATRTKLGAMLGIKEYPTPTIPGMFNPLLAARFPFVLTQSFSFLPKPAAQDLLQRQHNRLVNVGDLAISQAEELKDALDALTSNEFVMGDHHFSLQLLIDREEGAAENGVALSVKQLNDGLAQARTLLADTGMVVAREDLALEAAFWAQLPGNFVFRPRKAPITSRNFAAMTPFHNYPTGRATGNYWGDALTMLVSSAQSPYYFSLHAADPREPNGGSRRDTGHSFICGPTGSGKTVFVGFCIAMLQKLGAAQFVLDKDRGLEILVRALGGTYLTLQNGVSTGMNPLMLDPTPRNIEFLKTWLRRLIEREHEPLSVREEMDLEQALHGTLALDRNARRLSRLLEFLDPTDSEGAYVRLSRWCASCRGDYACVFDNLEDRVGELVTKGTIVGFDTTDFLDNEITCVPVTMYLFHLIRQALDGQRLVMWVDEFAKLVSDRAFEEFSRDGLKTWRKMNGVAAFATQSPSDVLSSPIARTIIEQTPTKVFFPNPDGNVEEYVTGFGLTDREFKLIKEDLEPGSRMFLIKQGHYSVVCRLDLRDFDVELDVISGRRANIDLVTRIIAEVGAAPRDWLAKFRQTRELP